MPPTTPSATTVFRRWQSPALRPVALGVALLLATLLLTACQTTSTTSSTTTAAASVDIQIADAAHRAAAALDRLHRLESRRASTGTPPPLLMPPSNAVALPVATTPTPPAVDPSRVPPELRRPLTLTWTGPMDQALTAILADLTDAGYPSTPNIAGPRPAAPVIVRIEAADRPAFEVIQDIALQAGTQALVRLDARSHRIDLVYAAPRT